MKLVIIITIQVKILMMKLYKWEKINNKQFKKYFKTEKIVK